LKRRRSAFVYSPIRSRQLRMCASGTPSVSALGVTAAPRLPAPARAAQGASSPR
jgi:hypothetical protein